MRLKLHKIESDLENLYNQRKLNQERTYISKEGKKIILHGRALLLNRNVGHLMTNPSVILRDGSEIPEGILDGFDSKLIMATSLAN